MINTGKKKDDLSRIKNIIPSENLIQLIFNDNSKHNLYNIEEKNGKRKYSNLNSHIIAELDVKTKKINLSYKLNK
ncbi:hypothetical protein CPAV1605_56 [seawater metagenome]|uniref:Uncharacterized protein n=1 Tax=seawater metagenome TaxID=1561972 RepID=A0A5E8CI37_9ZZZZ